MASKKDKRQGAWYKEKYPRSKYLERGDPYEVDDQLIETLNPWVPVHEDEKDIWIDLARTLFDKNKKREFLITPSSNDQAIPKLNAKGQYELTIEVLHIDHRGFTYTSAAESVEQLKRNFYPTMVKLVAHFISPRMLRKPEQKARN